MFEVPTQIKGLIFDCDGTIADNMHLHWEAWEAAMQSMGAHCPLEFLNSLRGIPTRNIIPIFNEQFGYTIDADEFSTKKNEIFDELVVKTTPIVPVVEIIHRYHNTMPMAVASGGGRKNVVRTLEILELDRHFQAIITADDPVAPKPSPDIFIEAANRIGIPPELCLVFEDGDSGLEAGIKAKMSVVDIRTKEWIIVK